MGKKYFFSVKHRTLHQSKKITDMLLLITIKLIMKVRFISVTKEQTFVPSFIPYISLPSASNLSLKYHGNKQICLIKLSLQRRREREKKKNKQRIFKS